MSNVVKQSSAPHTAPPRVQPRRELSLESSPRKTASAERSSDPYNTSGSFDRTKNWARVGKR
jgi:hypothetical protein